MKIDPPPLGTSQYSTNMAEAAIETAVFNDPTNFSFVKPNCNVSKMDPAVKLEWDVNVLLFTYAYKGYFEHEFDVLVLEDKTAPEDNENIQIKALNIYIKDTDDGEGDQPERPTFFRVNLSKFIDSSIEIYNVYFVDKDEQEAILLGSIKPRNSNPASI